MACQEVILQFFILLFYLICGVDGDSIAECFYPALEIKKVVSSHCKKKKRYVLPFVLNIFMNVLAYTTSPSVTMT